MKKIYCFCVVVCIFLGFSSGGDFAFASEIYARAEKVDVGFFASEVDSEPMFFVPKGYYVFVTGEIDDYYACEYAKTEGNYTKKYGFVRKADVVLDSDMALPIYPEISIVAIKESCLFRNRDREVVVSSISAGQEVCFYGIFQNEFYDMYYVKVGRDFGYVDISDFERLVVPSHPKLLASVVATQQPTTEPSATEVFRLSSDAQFAMILCVCVPILLVLIFAFKPKNDETTKYFE